MEKATRRNLLKAAAAGSVAAVGLGGVLKSGTTAHASESGDGDNRGRREDVPLSMTVTFGSHAADPTNPLDRFPTSSPNNRNVHRLIPEPTIRTGGTVNFVITGFHLLTIYDDGHLPTDINPNLLEPGTQFIADANRRIYRGLSPAALNYAPPPGTTTPLGVRDRVEAVQFPHAGRFLVICSFRPHFLDNMFGFVNVVGPEEENEGPEHGGHGGHDGHE